MPIDSLPQLLLRAAAALVGILLVLATIYSAVETFVVPRSANDPLTRFVFRRIFAIFLFFTRNAKTYAERDRVMAFFAPTGLLMLPPVWIFLVMMGFTLILVAPH